MLKGAFIGMGRMGITHYSILNAHPSVKIVGASDQSKTMLNFFNKYSGVRVFTDYKKMIEASKPDMVVISTPTNSHAEIIKYSINKDLHIFSEKPFAMTTAEGEEILKIISGKALVNQVGYVNRFNEVFHEVKRLLDEGIIGRIKHFRCEMFGSTVSKGSKSSWRSKRNLGGGCMYEFASHCIDLVVYLLGFPEKTSGNILQSIFSPDVEDLISSTFIYKGFTGNILVNWSDVTYRKPTNKIEIYGEKGKIVADKHAYKVFIRDSAGAGEFHRWWNTRYITDFAKNVHFYVRGNEFSLQLAYFVECIKNKRLDNISSFSEAFKTDLIIKDIFENCMEVRHNG